MASYPESELILNPDGSVKEKDESSHDYKVILRELVDYAKRHNFHIFSKIARRSKDLIEDDEIQSLHREECVSLVRPEKDQQVRAGALFSKRT